MPLEFAPGVTPEQQSAVLAACARWTAAAGVRCVRHGSETLFVTVSTNTEPKYDSSCASSVGLGWNAGSAMSIHLGRSCWAPGVILHELGHSFGLIHEHQRPDRDSWIQLHWEHIDPSFSAQYDRISSSYLASDYDYFSIMHYGSWSASKDGEPTFTPLKLADPGDAARIGALEDLGPSDGPTLRRMYARWLEGIPEPIEIPAGQADRIADLPAQPVSGLNAAFKAITGRAAPDPELCGLFGTSSAETGLSGQAWLALLTRMGLARMLAPTQPLFIGGVASRGLSDGRLFFEAYGGFPATDPVSRSLRLECDGVTAALELTYSSEGQINFALLPSPAPRTCQLVARTDLGSSEAYSFAIDGTPPPPPAIFGINPRGLAGGLLYFEIYGNFPYVYASGQTVQLSCASPGLPAQIVPVRVPFASENQINAAIPPSSSARDCSFRVFSLGGYSEPFALRIAAN
jgi:hypothetical protein